MSTESRSDGIEEFRAEVAQLRKELNSEMDRAVKAEEAVERLTEERDSARQTLTVYDNSLEYARGMFERLPFNFGSNNFYESCDQVVREVESLISVDMSIRKSTLLRDLASYLEHYSDKLREAGLDQWADYVRADVPVLRKAATVLSRDEPLLPSIESLTGSMPDITGGRSVEEHMLRLRGGDSVNTEYDPGIPESDVERGTAHCKICSVPQPSGHISVRNEKGEIIGRICSKHTFLEATRTGVLFVDITEIPNK